MKNDVVMLDETDRKILNTLLDNSRLSFRKIAKKTGVSVATVMNRVSKLQKEKVIKNYSTSLDYERIDYDVEALIEVKISRAKSNPFDVDPFVLNHPNVNCVYDVSGDIDHVIFVKFQNRRQLNTFLRKLNSLPAIENSQTRFILKNFKEEAVRV